MSKKKEEKQAEQPQPEQLPAPPQALRPNTPMTSKGLAPRTIDEAWQFAKALSASAIIPDSYKNRPQDCMIALDIAARTGSNWLAVMQHIYVVHGRPAFDSQFTIGLVNQSGQYAPIEYDVEGEDARKDGYRVRAYTHRIGSDVVLYGPWIDWQLVKAEGWDKKDGSKWRTMPEVMFHYRAGTWWQRRHAPEMTLGMPTMEELEDVGDVKAVQSTVVTGNDKLLEALGEVKPAPEPAPEPFEAGPQEKPEEPPQQEEKPAGGCQCIKCGCESGQTAEQMKGTPCPNCGSKLGWK